MSEAPRRVRRSDRYRQSEPAEAAAAQPVQALIEPEAEPVNQPEPEQPPTPMQRPPHAPQQKRSAPKRKKPAVPLWLKAFVAVAVLAVAGQAVAQAVMNGYLDQCERERQQAHERVLESHPVLYADLIEEYAAAYNLEPNYVKAIILNESSFRWNAESSVGARGLMQLMPDTAEWIADKIGETGYTFEKLFDPETNIRFGTWYLNYLTNMFRGDPVLVTAAYHAGQGQVTAWLNDRSMSPDGVMMPLENMKEGPTKTYVGRVTRDYAIYHALADEEAAELDAVPDAGAAAGAEL